MSTRPPTEQTCELSFISVRFVMEAGFNRALSSSDWLKGLRIFRMQDPKTSTALSNV